MAALIADELVCGEVSGWRRITGLPDYRSEACGAIHETMEALREVGAIDKRTMREFDDACLAPVVPMPPDRIRALRERGVKKPGGPALRLLSVVEKNGIQAIA